MRISGSFFVHCGWLGWIFWDFFSRTCPRGIESVPRFVELELGCWMGFLAPGLWGGARVDELLDYGLALV